jgi:hypothetical protein
LEQIVEALDLAGFGPVAAGGVFAAAADSEASMH